VAPYVPGCDGFRFHFEGNVKETVDIPPHQSVKIPIDSKFRIRDACESVHMQMLSIVLTCAQSPMGLLLKSDKIRSNQMSVLVYAV
jgi:hypothetical protein